MERRVEREKEHMFLLSLFISGNSLFKDQKLHSKTWYHLYVESKVQHKWTYLWHRNKLTDIRNLWLPRWVGWGRKGLGVWDRCKLLYRGWINNQFLLYRTGNSIQYPVINHNGKEYKKVYIYIYIYTHTHTDNWITLLYNRNEHCKSTILQ